MTLESLQAFTAFLATHPDQPLLLRGEGEAFSAGLDLDALVAADPRPVAAAIEAAAAALFRHPAPTVAAVNGHAIAGGCLLLQACDLRLCEARESIRIGMPGVALGINYPPTLIRILKYRVPAGALEQVLLGADNHSPAQAMALGLVDACVMDAPRAAREALERLARHPAAAYAQTKRALRSGVLEVGEQERAAFERDFAERWAAEQLQANRRDKR